MTRTRSTAAILTAAATLVLTATAASAGAAAEPATSSATPGTQPPCQPADLRMYLVDPVGGTGDGPTALVALDHDGTASCVMLGVPAVALVVGGIAVDTTQVVDASGPAEPVTIGASTAESGGVGLTFTAVEGPVPDALRVTLPGSTTPVDLAWPTTLGGVEGALIVTPVHRTVG